MCAAGTNWQTQPAFHQNRKSQSNNFQEDSMDGTASVWIIVGLSVVAFMCLIAMVARLFRKAGPHEALVVYGFRKTRVVIGAGTVIFPMIENFKLLSLELMSFDVAPQQDLYTNQGVAVKV